MATIEQGWTASFIDEVPSGIHDLDADTLRMALYDDNAVLGRATTAYASTNEVSGTGYTATGAALVLAIGYPQQDATTGVKSYRFDPVQWSGATFSARAGLIYNATKANRSVMVLDFGTMRSVSASTFTVAFPATLPPIFAFRG